MTFKCWGCGWQGSSTMGGACPSCGATDYLAENTQIPEREYKAQVYGDFPARCKCPPENFLHLDTCPEFFPGGLKRHP